jgi:RNA polymerase sigma-70 factor, ECF subfamily
MITSRGLDPHSRSNRPELWTCRQCVERSSPQRITFSTKRLRIKPAMSGPLRAKNQTTKMNHSTSRDEGLMTKQEKFATAVVEHLPYLKRLVRSLTRCDPMSDDIVQETVLKALIHADQFRFDSTLKTWLTSIAFNEVRQLHRSKWRACTIPLVDNSEEDWGPSAALESSGYQAKEREALVRQAVSRLPPSYRCIVELCDLHDLSLREAAKKLSLTLSAVKSRRHRAMQKLSPLVEKLRV